MPDQTTRATEVKQRHEKKWLTIPGVTAVGVGKVDDTIGLIISVEKNPDSVRAQIPQQVEGIPTRIQMSGTLRAG